MRKKIKVKHTHRYTNEKAILFEGQALCNEFNDYIEYLYNEADGTKVMMYIYSHRIEIKRHGEVLSSLDMQPEKKTKNLMKSPYGEFEIEIYTYDFQNDGNYIMVEYDVENGLKDKDGFKIEIEVEEEGYEFH